MVVSLVLARTCNKVVDSLDVRSDCIFCAVGSLSVQSTIKNGCCIWNKDTHTDKSTLATKSVEQCRKQTKISFNISLNPFPNDKF